MQTGRSYQRAQWSYQRAQWSYHSWPRRPLPTSSVVIPFTSIPTAAVGSRTGVALNPPQRPSNARGGKSYKPIGPTDRPDRGSAKSEDIRISSGGTAPGRMLWSNFSSWCLQLVTCQWIPATSRVARSWRHPPPGRPNELLPPSGRPAAGGG